MIHASYIYENNKDKVDIDFIYKFITNYNIDLIDISKQFNDLLNLIKTIPITEVTEFVYFSSI